MEEQREATAVKSMSFTDKLVNIFASPGELFENVRDTGKTNSNWVIPSIIFIVVTVVLSQLLLTNPELTSQIGAMTRKAFDKAVQDGKLTQDLADQQYERFGPGSIFFTISTFAGPVVFTFVRLFVVALIYWLLGKSVMKAQAPYMKVVEVVGLTMLIGTLEVLVSNIMVFATTSITASPSLGFFVSDFDLENKVHVALSKVNVFTFWELIVTSIGLSKLFRRDLPKVLVLVFVLWLLFTAVTVLTGIRLS